MVHGTGEGMRMSPTGDSCPGGREESPALPVGQARPSSKGQQRCGQGLAKGASPCSQPREGQ